MEETKTEVKETVTEVTPTPAATTTSSTTMTEVKPHTGNKKPLMICAGIVALLLLCCCGGFALFGYVSDGEGDCSFQGPFASDANCSKSLDNSDDEDEEENDDEEIEDEENDIEEDTDNEDVSSDTEELNTGEFTIEYPSDWFYDTEIDEEGKFTDFFYATNPEDVESGDLNDNVNVKELGDWGDTSISESDCEDFGVEVSNLIAEDLSFDSSELDSTEVTEIDGASVCRITMNNVYLGIDLVQDEYLFINPVDGGNSFIVTSTSYPGSDNEDLVLEIAESFRFL